MSISRIAGKIGRTTVINATSLASSVSMITKCCRAAERSLTATVSTLDSTAANFNLFGDGDMKWGVFGALEDVVLERSAAATLSLTTGNLDLDANLNVDGELTGSRSIVQFGSQENDVASRYICWGSVTSGNCSFVTPRAGSIVGVSGGCNSWLDVGTPAITLGTWLDGTSKITTGNIWTSGAGWKQGYNTQARDTSGSTFTAGQKINCYLTITGTVTASYCQCAVEVQLDS